MGTRGYFIFKYKDVYYIIYNNNDSYVSCMGVKNAEVIKQLCKMFNGNIGLAKEHLGKLMENIVFKRTAGGKMGLWKVKNRDELSNEAVKVTPEDTKKYKTILESTSEGFDIVAMARPNVMILCEDILYPESGAIPESDGIFIEYLWEVDIDGGTFGMGMSESDSIFIRLPWKALYLLPIKEFEKDANFREEKLNEGYVFGQGSFHRIYNIILLQAYVRRYLTIRKALLPPNGYLYLKAKRQFQKDQAKVAV